MTRGMRWIIGGVAVLFALTQNTNAQSFSVSYTNGTVFPCNGSTTVLGPYSPGSNVTVALPACARRVNIYATSNSVSIGRITLADGPLDGNLDVVLGTGTLATTDFPPSSAGGSWAGLSTSLLDGTPIVRFGGAISGNLTQSIDVSQISRFDVGGAVQAQIRADNSINFGGIFVVECGSVSSAGSIVLENNSILRVLATGFGVNGPIAALTGNIGVIETQNGGPLLADVNADMGSINQILVDGEIGSTSTSPLIRAMDGINTIDAAAIYATITSNAGGVGGVRRVRTTSGPFVGALNAYRIESATATDGLRITGNLDANVTIADNVLRPIVITGELMSGRTLSIAGQMITATTPSTTGSLDIGTLRGTVRFTRTTQGVRGPVTIDSIASTGRLESSSPLESGTNGSITVDGNMAGLVQVSGSVAGAITIGGELDGRVTTTGSLTGALTIDSYMDGLIKVWR